MPADDVTRLYLDRWFWTLGQLAEAVGTPPARIEQLVAAGCAPGPIYAHDGENWWSALGSEGPPPSGEHWYSPAAAWGLRQTELALREGRTPSDAAAALRDRFAEAFVGALAVQRHARLAFAHCFDGDAIQPTAAREAAHREWTVWLGGGYGVCLRVFTAESCVAKEALGAWIKAAIAEPDYDARSLLSEAEALAGLILPFAPWQRPLGTPGLTIDRLLHEQGLGVDRPYG